MKRHLVLWSITSALAGFLFGFDTVVISGAEQTIQHLWGLSSAMHGFVMGSAPYGTVLGSLVGGWPTARFGRKKTLLLIGLLYVVSAVGCALAASVDVFVAARFLGGLGIGISTVVSPLYIAEIAPADYRGRLAGLFQFNIVLGIVVAFLSNAIIARYGGADAWRWMLGVAAVPSLIYAAMCVGLPESPRWLITARQNRAAGLAVLRLIEPGKTEKQLAADVDAIAAATHRSAASSFWSARLRRPIRLAVLIAVFNQLSGINAILYFAPRIFEMTGLGEKAALLQSVGIGVTNLLFTFAGLALIDRVGRRTLLYIGSYGYILSLGLTAWAFATGHFGVVPACIFAFIAAHAVGQGTVIWVFIAEIFPNRHRAAGQALGSFTHWVWAAILTTAFPKMVELSGANRQPQRAGYIFGFFMAMMVVQLVWVITMVPETKGVPLEQMQARIGAEG
jgi:sugar porter (SP) family MFS transporter